MKPATANRVYLLHQEGNVPFKHRGKVPKKSDNDDDYSVDQKHVSGSTVCMYDMCIYMCVCLCLCEYVCVCIYTYIYVCVCMYVCK